MAMKTAMQTQHKLLTALVLATLVSSPLAFGQEFGQDSPMALAAYVPNELPVDSAAVPPAPAQSTFSQQELDQMVAPIALYPDQLLSQILMAATYPLEIVQAARWVRDNSSLQGEEAVRAADSQQQDWDPSVKSLVAFPQVLAMMNENITWTERLGNAFLGQQAQVALSVQNLRQRAEASGNLASGAQMRVEQQSGDIAIAPANPQLVYAPYYDPNTVYGDWPWQAYPPVYFRPLYGYYPQPGLSFYWGSAIALSAGFFFGAFDWHHHYVSIVNTRPFYYHGGGFGGRGWGPVAGAGPWQHDAGHRHGVAYNNANQQSGRTGQGFGNQGFGGQAAAAPRFQAPVQSRSFERAPAPRFEEPVARERQTVGFNQAGGAAYMSQVRSFAAPVQFQPHGFAPAPQYAFHNAAAVQSFAGGGSYSRSYSYSRPGMSSASFAHSAPSSRGGGGGHSSSGGGHGGHRR
jgi:uncharacterized membrane protein YgcG